MINNSDLGELLYHFFFETINIIETETLRKMQRDGEKRYEDAAYRCNI